MKPNSTIRLCILILFHISILQTNSQGTFNTQISFPNDQGANGIIEDANGNLIVIGT